MSLLFRILYATHANGTHHKLALDALNHLRGSDAEAWRKVFLANAEIYLEGSKAPDKQFKDFTNHVLHVRDGYWGGAATKVTNWYAHTIEALKNQSWSDAVYAAGVMSHYYTDPIMPFHTAQSEAENNIHRAAEWSINKSYNDLNQLAKTAFPVPDVPIEDRDDWLADLVCDAAEISNGFYETLIANYDLDRGVVDPPLGLNERARRIVAQLIAYAQVGQARILERAFAEAGVTPPDVELDAATVIAGLKIPLKWVTRKMADAQDRAAVIAMYDELQATGTVEKTLSEDDRAVRQAFRKEVGHNSRKPRPEFRPPHTGGAFDYASALKKRDAADKRPQESNETQQPLAPAETAERKTAEQPKRKKTKSEEKTVSTSPVVPASENRPDPETVSTEASSAAPNLPENAEPADDAPFDAAAELRQRAAEMSAADTAEPAQAEVKLDYRLDRNDEVEDGPSVGPKTALRLNKIGIVTVADLLRADPNDTASDLNLSYVKPATVIDWQDQARLQCDVPGLSGTAAQLIVGAGYGAVEELAGADVSELVAAVTEFCESAQGERIMRDRPVPEEDRIKRWITNAQHANVSEDNRSAA